MLRCHIVETRNIRSKERFTKNNYLDKKTACKESSVMLAKSISRINTLFECFLVVTSGEKKASKNENFSLCIARRTSWPQSLRTSWIGIVCRDKFFCIETKLSGNHLYGNQSKCNQLYFVMTNLKPSKNHWHKVNYGASQSDPYQSHPSKSHIF